MDFIKPLSSKCFEISPKFKDQHPLFHPFITQILWFPRDTKEINSYTVPTLIGLEASERKIYQPS
jgi:hypothetical protein